MVEEEIKDRRKIRWKLALGQVDEPLDQLLNSKEQQVDQALDRIYQSDRSGGLSSRRNFSAKWMGEIKTLFPSPVVRIMQRDALDKFGIKKLLSQPAFIDEIEPDVGMVATILSAKDSLSPSAKQAARKLVARLAKKVEQKLKFKLVSRIYGVRNNRIKISNPHHREIDWHLTIKANLKSYQPSLKTIIPEKIIGHPSNRNQSKRLIILVDQSASMAESFVYAGILGSIMSTIASLKTHLIIFDTDVVDLTDYLQDPVELLFRAQLGGGTNIRKALSYAAEMVYNNPGDSYLILISDLFEGGPLSLLYEVVQEITNHDIPLISLLALDDQGIPAFDREVAKTLASMGVPSFGSTPENFPEIVAAALNKEDLRRFEK
ncbi:MAG: VWA domain-containing protein [Saprospiraceae bacterium]|nr:VWA domain-containing protein [Saprospiraceae bacterium]